MMFNLKLEVDNGYIDEYYGNLSEMFGEMLREEIKASLRKVIKEELQKDELQLAAEVRKVVHSLSLRMNPTEIADLAYAIVDSTINKGNK
jgi:F0F1-type ATP synthase membrane subunit b/b'